MLAKKILRGTTLSFAFIILGALFSLLFRRLLALEMSVSSFGLLFSVISFFSFIALFVNMGLDLAATKLIVELRVKNAQKRLRSLVISTFAFQLLIAFILTVLIYFLAPVLATYYFHDEQAITFLRYLGIWFVTIPLYVFISFILLGFEKTTWFSSIDTVRTVFLYALVSLLFYVGYEAHAPLIAYAMVNLFVFLLYTPYILSFFPNLFHLSKELFDKKLFRKVFTYGIFVSLANFGWLALSQTDIFVLTYFRGLEEVGYYNVALPLSLLLLFVIRPVTIVFTPLVTDLYTRRKQEKLKSALAMAYKFAFILLLPIAGLFILYPSEIISLLFSSKYLNAKVPFMILSIGTLFYTLSLFTSAIFTALGRAKQMAYVIGGLVILNVVLNLLFVPSYGMNAAAAATSFSYFILFIVSSFYLHRIINFKFPTNAWIISSLVAIGLVLGTSYIYNSIMVSHYYIIGFGILFLTVYFGALVVFRVVDIKGCITLIKEAMHKI